MLCCIISFCTALGILTSGLGFVAFFDVLEFAIASSKAFLTNVGESGTDLHPAKDIETSIEETSTEQRYRLNDDLVKLLFFIVISLLR